GTDEYAAACRGTVRESCDNFVGRLLHAHEPLAVLGADAANGRFLVQRGVEVGAVHGRTHRAVGQRRTVLHLTEALSGTAGHHHPRGRESGSLDPLVGPEHTQTVQTIGGHVHETADAVRGGVVG